MRYTRLADYARKCFREGVSVSDNDFITGQGLHYVKLPNNQAVVIDRSNGDIAKFWFNENGEIAKMRAIKGGKND